MFAMAAADRYANERGAVADQTHPGATDHAAVGRHTLAEPHAADASDSLDDEAEHEEAQHDELVEINAEAATATGPETASAASGGEVEQEPAATVSDARAVVA